MLTLPHLGISTSEVSRMKHKIHHFNLIHVVLAALSAVSGICCLASAFDLIDAHTLAAVIVIFPFSLLCDFSMSRRRVFPILALISIILCLLFAETLLPSVEWLLFSLTKRYNNAYGWGYIRWSGTLSVTSAAPALALLGCLIVVPILWTLGRRKWVGFALIPGLIPLMLCCVVTDTIPDATFLVLLLVCLLLLLLTQLTRRQNSGQSNRIAAILPIPVMLFTLALSSSSMEDPHAYQAQLLQDRFMEIVEFFTDSVNTSGNGPLGTNGTPGAEVDLQDIGPWNPNEDTVMTVQADHSGVLYLRGQSYDTYTGTSWISNLNATGELGWPTITDTDLKNVTLSLRSTLDLRYFPYYVQNEDWTSMLADGAYQNPNRKKTYSFSWATADSGTSVSLSMPSSQVQQTYTELPLSTQTAAQAIVTELLNGAEYDTQAELVAAIGDYVQNSASYNRNTQSMPEEAADFALWFLEESDTGYCVHFASAATVLLRAAGIPARYVTGYIAYTLPGHVTNVTGEQAHAWVEYLDDETGWTVLDATPGADDLAALPETTTPPTQTTTAPTETTAPPTETTRPSVPSETTLPTQPQTTRPAEKPDVPPTVNTAWVAPVLRTLLVCALIFLQYGLRLRLRNRWLNRGSTKRRALRRWKYTRYLAWLTRQKAPERLKFLAEKAVFSQHRLTVEELAEFDLWISDAQIKLLRKPWPFRLLVRIVFAVK